MGQFKNSFDEIQGASEHPKGSYMEVSNINALDFLKLTTYMWINTTEGVISMKFSNFFFVHF